jgi:hypothetical protein
MVKVKNLQVYMKRKNWTQIFNKKELIHPISSGVYSYILKIKLFWQANDMSVPRQLDVQKL